MIFKRIGYVITCIALAACGGAPGNDPGGGAVDSSQSSPPRTAVEPLVPTPSGVPAGLTASPEPLVCVGTKQVAAGLPATEGASEVYYPDAMNLKLTKHALLRERTGLKTVRTCAEAGTFKKGYQKLLAEQPELFIHQPVGAPALPSFRPESEDRPFAPQDVASANGDLGTSREAVLNGTTTTQYGTVLLSVAGDGQLCSGIAISKFHHLTAAHCWTGISGWYRGAISRYACTGGTCFLVPTLYSEMWLYLTRSPYYTGLGDYADDISVVTIYHVYDDGTVTFPDPSAGNALRLWLGDLYANSTVATMYGFGGNATNGTGVGVLRTGTNTISSVSAGWFWATRTGTQALCQGDSGGPAVVNTDKAAGIASTVSTAPCPAVGGWSLWTRIAPQMGWIEGVMAYPFGTGYQCGRYGSGATAYARCW